MLLTSFGARTEAGGRTWYRKFPWTALRCDFDDEM